MAFQMYGEVILTRDVPGERAACRRYRNGRGAARRARCPRGRLLGRILRHDGQHCGSGHAAGERSSSSHTGRSSRGSRPQRLNRPGAPEPLNTFDRWHSVGAHEHHAAARFQERTFGPSDFALGLNRIVNATASPRINRVLATLTAILPAGWLSLPVRASASTKSSPASARAGWARYSARAIPSSIAMSR